MLLSHRVRFLIVGAHALAANGRPRATQDIDFWVEPNHDNATRLCNALAAFGFQGLAGAAEEFAQPNKMATLGRPPFRIDVMTSIDGVIFEEAWEERVEAEFGDHAVPFLSRRHLIENKLATGRTKDRLDVELLNEGDSAD